MIKRIILLTIIWIMLPLQFGCTSQSKPGTIQSEPIPEADNNSGVIYGYLFDNNNQPIMDTIYLSQDIAHDNPELPPTISFSLQSDPRGNINVESGFFYFDDVAPADNYVITIFIGAGQPYTVRGENPEMPLFIEVSAGERINLGEIVVDYTQ